MTESVKKPVRNGLGCMLLFFVLVMVCFSFGGFRCYTVLSGSMEPEYPVGSLIIVKPIKKAPGYGDVITFRKGDMIVTHRITEVFTEEENTKRICYRTKGDANNTDDEGLVKEEDVIGIPVGKIPCVGYLIVFFQNLTAKLTGVFL